MTTPLESFTSWSLLLFVSRGMIDKSLPHEAALGLGDSDSRTGAHCVRLSSPQYKLAFNDRMFFLGERTFENA